MGCRLRGFCATEFRLRRGSGFLQQSEMLRFLPHSCCLACFCRGFWACKKRKTAPKIFHAAVFGRQEGLRLPTLRQSFSRPCRVFSGSSSLVLHTGRLCTDFTACFWAVNGRVLPLLYSAYSS